MTKQDLFSYYGGYEDFEDGSDRYYAQLAVDYHGSAVRDNTINELVVIGRELELSDL
jgi:hypothetical protein